MTRLAALLLAFLATATGCTAHDPDTRAGDQTAAIAPAGADTATGRVHVRLWHCGVDPVRYGGGSWQIAWPPPFDETNAPGTFSGVGTLTVTGDRARYVDDAGTELRLFPEGSRVTRPPKDFGCR